MDANVKKLIYDDIVYATFCLIVDESRDDSRREQMALVIYFVDKDGFIRKHFLDIVHVHDTSLATLRITFFYLNIDWMFKIFKDKGIMV